MEKLPQSVLKQLQGSQTMNESEPHPDPDLLTAFAENSLPALERAPILYHLGHCKDCRDTLAIAASALEYPAGSRTLPAASLAPSPWFVWPAFRWAALAAGVLIVASVGILQFGHNRQIKQVASSLSPNETSLSAASPSSEVEKPLQNDTSEARKVPTAAENSGLHNDPRSESEAAIHHEPNPAPTQTQLAENQPVPPLSQDNNRDVVKAKNPVPAQSNPASANLLPQNQVPASFASLRWAINAGVLQRSEDDGRTWQTVNPSAGSSTEFFSIAVNGADVWVGGSAGSLYHSRDAGAYWIPVTPSINGTSLTGNVIGIQFSNPLHASITTSTYEVWATSDAGQTWVKKQ